MTGEERLLYAIGEVEDRLLEDCEELFARSVPVGRKRWRLPAACLCAALAAGLLLRFSQPFLQGAGLGGIPGGTENSSSWGSSYDEIAQLIPWEELSLPEQYTTLTLEGLGYTTRNTEISREQLGAPLGSGTVVGWDPITAREHSTAASIYALENIHVACGVAVEFSLLPGQYWVYGALDYHPQSLGQLMEEMDLEHQLTVPTLRYHRQSLLGGERVVEVEQPDNSLIWDFLRQQGDAPAIAGYDQWILRRSGQDGAMEFSVDLPLFGVENLSMAFTEDGWLTTNILGHGAAFYLGESRTKELLEQVKTWDGDVQPSSEEPDGEAGPSQPPAK